MNSGIDCYMSAGTSKALNVYGEHYRLCLMSAGIQCNINDFVILPFSTEHYASEPLGFFIQYMPTGERLLFATDTFYLHNLFPKCNYIMIEANYIKETLDENVFAGRIHESLKPRLLKSHMSLEHCLQFLQANDLSQCKKLILIHLSDSNSDAARMQREVQELTGVDTVVADAGLEIELELYPY